MASAAVAVLVAVAAAAVVPSADACVEASILRDATTSGNSCSSILSNNLLFWSSYDFSLDAAEQFFGPLDLLLRGGAASAERAADPEEGESSSATTTVAETAAPDDATPRSNRTNFRDGAVVSDKNKMIFSFFQKGDGSESDPDGIPARYLKMQNGHRDRAALAVESTLQWRAEHDIDRLLLTPQTKFDVCKHVFPHAFLGRDKDNHVVFLQRPALIDLQRGKKNKLTNDELLLHYVYVNEYLWQILEATEPLGTMISLLDLTGLDFSVLKKRELIGFVKKFVSTMDSHFPQRSHKTLILNAPKWFNALFKMFSPLLRESTKAKIEIHSRGKKQDEALRRTLGDAVAKLLPPSLWSKKHTKGKKRGDHKDGDEPEVDHGDDDPQHHPFGQTHHHHHKHHHHQHEDPHSEVIPETELEKELRAFVSLPIRHTVAHN